MNTVETTQLELRLRRRALTSGLRPTAASVIALTAALGGGLVASPALAQSPSSEPATVDTVIVTASRVDRAGFTAPTPTTVVTAEEFALRAVTSVADGLNQTPAFFANTTPATGGNQRSNGNANYLNLRALGANRTLVLVNGRRHVPTTSGGALDINLIPQALISRVEVVTGGASAAWGSDAVAGVVNLIFDDRLDGGRASVQYGVSSRGDNRETKATLAQGFSFAQGRGHAAIAGEWYRNSGILDQQDRNWGRQEWQIVNNANATATNGQYLRLRSPYVHQSGRTESGLILSGPLANMQFGPGGVLQPFRLGQVTGGGFMIGGDGINQGTVTSLVTPGERKTLYATASYELTPTIKGSVEASYARIESSNDMLASFSTAPYLIRVDNPFLPTAVRNQMIGAGQTQLQVGRINTDFGFIVAHPVNETKRIVGALDGSFGETWKWSAYYTYGQNYSHDRTENNLIVGRAIAAMDAIRDPVSGQIVCRSAATAPACVPLNIVGYGAPSASAINYVTGTTESWTTNKQQVAAFSLTGEPFSSWAGPVSVALGGELRRESIKSTADPISVANGFLVGNPKNLSGKYDVKEVFLETVVPLIADLPFVKSLDFNGAVRLTDYSSSGSVVTWKAGLTYQINDAVRLRGTASRDIRAANLTELYQSSATSFATIRDPRPGSGAPAALVNNVTGGNPNLKPEEADTWTVGIVLSPSAIPGLRASIDYYDIDIQGAIGALSAQSIVDRCFTGGQTALCPLITINPATNAITRTDASFLNLSETITRGVDAEISYTRQIADGDLTIRLLSTYVANLITNDGVLSIDRAGQVAGQGADAGLPRWRSTATVAYRRGPLALSAATRYVGGGKVDVTYTGLAINDNSVKSRTYLDLSVEYALGEGDTRVKLFGAVNNVFDKDPPLVGTTFQAPFYTNAALYDVVGRFITVGLRVSY
ncbi:TonB-dependent receptor domain-containing protein [Phenylobacterium sp.]|uniref:TonB-dependent receptor domain-containing protein n=1 Tax=Phenylobacterium sp. TaxID=1871053 RepID=UPI002FC61FA5